MEASEPIDFKERTDLLVSREGADYEGGGRKASGQLPLPVYPPSLPHMILAST